MNDTVDNQQGIQRRERRDAVENRERVLAAARQLFAQQGVEATSMNEIAQVAQVGPGTLYRRFAHKGELCEALLKDSITELWERIDKAQELNIPESALGRLSWLLDELILMGESHRPLISAIMAGGGKPKYQDLFQTPFYLGMHERIARLLKEAIAEGEAEDLNIDFIADIIIWATAPPLLAFQRQHRGLSIEQIMASTHHLFIDGIQSRPDGKEVTSH